MCKLTNTQGPQRIVTVQLVVSTACIETVFLAGVWFLFTGGVQSTLKYKSVQTANCQIIYFVALIQLNNEGTTGACNYN